MANFYVTVPDVPGVPPVLRLPASAVASAQGVLTAAANQMADVAAQDSATLGSVSDLVYGAQANTNNALATITTFPSAIMNDALGPASAAASSLNSLAMSVLSTPSSLVSAFSGTISNIQGSISNALDSFSGAAAALGGGIPGLGSDLVPDSAGSGPQWGVFDQDGNAVITADTFVSLEYKQEWPISDYVIEDGGFASYDKIELPFDVRVTFASGGSLANRQALLDSIDAIAYDLNLYDVITPEKTYHGVSCSHYDYSRKATNGVGLIQVTIWFTEIRVQGTASFTQTATPGAASPAATGAVQTTTPTAPQASALYGAVGSLVP